MSRVTERRAALRREAAELQKQLVPKLRAMRRALQTHRKRRLRKCAADCKARKARVQRDAIRAREKLRERIAAAREKAKAACGVCRVNARGKDLERLDQALQALELERQRIGELRRKAAGLVDERGRAGGRRSAELRAESDDEVRRNVADDLELAALWDSVDKRKFKSGPRRNRTEAFLEWAESHPEALDELRARQWAQWEREADELYAALPRGTGRMREAELEGLVKTLKRVERLSDEVPF